MNQKSRNNLIHLIPAYLRAAALALGLVCLASPVVAGSLQLTDAEQAYLKKNTTIEMCVDPDWKPYEMLGKQGRHVGIVAEYINLFQKRLGVTIEPVPVKTWAESQALYRQGRCDIVSALNRTDERAKYLDFSEPYLKSPAVLVVRADEPRIRDLGHMQGNTLAMVKGYVYESSLKKDYPDIRLVPVANMEEGLQRVADGKVDATLGPLFLIAASIQNLGLDNLNIMGSTPYQDELRVGVRKGDAVLLGLMNKSVSGLTGSDHAEAKRRGLAQVK